MRVRFWGVRGALAATGRESLGVGGNTPCVEVRDARGALLVLDAGIGLYWLGRALLAGPHGRGRGKVTLVLSNTHWDHIQGFPFFVPVFIPGNEVRVWGGGAAHIENLLEGQLNPTYSPLASLANLGADVQARQLEPRQELKVGALKVRHALLEAGPQHVIAYRIEDGERSLCYVPRVSHPPNGADPAFLELARGADLLVHEAFYTDEELARGGLSLGGKGAPSQTAHSTYERATRAALDAGARQLLFFYHHPDRDDAALDAQVAAARARVAAAGAALKVDAAREGVELQV
jgi:phosphoribosyl 1,2-cyclic phosphodiesterase